MKIQEPIYIVEHDTKEVVKYDYLENAENDLEAYDISNYSGYDASFRTLELFKKDKYNRVGFKLRNNQINKNELKKHIKDDLQVDHIDDFESFLKNMISYEQYMTQSKINNKIPLIFLLIVGLTILLLFIK